MILEILKKKSNIKKYFYILSFSFLVFSPLSIKAAVLFPGNISTCGELAAPGTYTLTQNVSGGDNACFVLGSDNITINGGGFVVSGTGTTSPAIDARVRTGGPTGPLTEGANAYTNLIINDLNISGYTIGLNISGNNDLTGNGINNGYAGDAGDTAIYYSYIGSITADGGQSSTKTYGGLAGNVFFTDTDLNISNSIISLLGGMGTINRNTHGVFDLNYSGTLTKTNLILSTLSSLNDNANTYPTYPGGSWPITPGDISTCGTLMGPGTFTLTQSVTSSSTCFYVYSNNVTIDGDGYSVISATTTDTSPVILAGNYSNFILASTTVSNFSNLIISSSSVIISGNDLDLSNTTLSATSLSIQAGILNISTTTVNATNSTLGSRGGITVSYTAPVLPVSRAGVITPATTVNNNLTTSRAVSGTTLDRIVNPNIRPLNFNPLQNFNLLNVNTNTGSTVIPNPLHGFKTPKTIDFVKLPINFLNNVSKFVLNSVSRNNLNKYPENIVKYLRLNGIDVNKDQDLVRLNIKPVSVNVDKSDLGDNMFDVKLRRNNVNTNISYDNNLNSLIQTIKIPVNTYIVLGSDNVKSIRYFNKTFTLNRNIDVLTPEKAGRYIIQSSNIPFVMDAFEPVPETKVKSKGLWNWIKGWFK